MGHQHPNLLTSFPSPPTCDVTDSAILAAASSLPVILHVFVLFLAPQGDLTCLR